jgi:ribonuclease R
MHEDYHKLKSYKFLAISDSNEAKILSILAESQFESAFPSEVEAFAETISDQIPDNELQRRKDLRDEVTFTIDPADAKDFDDAISIQT